MKRPLGVLVADDEAHVLRLLDVILRRAGLRCWLARCGREAVELLREDGGDIDVALLDVMMPGLSGPEALRRMRALRPELPCVFITGNAGLYFEEELRALAGRVVYKPFAVDEVVRAVREAAGEAVGPVRRR
jgi:CheY-like chemotaxis protein